MRIEVNISVHLPDRQHSFCGDLCELSLRVVVEVDKHTITASGAVRGSVEVASGIGRRGSLVQSADVYSRRDIATREPTCTLEDM